MRLPSPEDRKILRLPIRSGLSPVPLARSPHINYPGGLLRLAHAQLCRRWKRVRAEFRAPLFHFGGGSVFAALTVVGDYIQRTLFSQPVGKAVSVPLWGIILIATILIAQFLTYYDVRKERERATAQRDDLQDLRDYEDAINQLSAYFDDGNGKIFNARVTNDVEYGQWRADWQRWHDEVEDFLEKNFGLREKNLFKNLVLVERREIFGSYNGIHNFDRCMVAQQLESLRGTIVRHSERAEKWRVKSQSSIASTDSFTARERVGGARA